MRTGQAGRTGDGVRRGRRHWAKPGDRFLSPVCGGRLMTSANVQGVRLSDPDKRFSADEARKSNLVLEAQLLRARQQTDEAAAPVTYHC